MNRQKAEYRQDLNNLKTNFLFWSTSWTENNKTQFEIKARVRNLKQSYQFARQELDITKPLADEGVVPRIELLAAKDKWTTLPRNDLKRAQSPLLRSAIKEAMLSRIDAALNFQFRAARKSSTKHKTNSLH